MKARIEMKKMRNHDNKKSSSPPSYSSPQSSSSYSSPLSPSYSSPLSSSSPATITTSNGISQLDKYINSRDNTNSEICRRTSGGGALLKAINRRQSMGRERRRNSEFKSSDPLEFTSRKLVMEGLVQMCKGNVIKERCMFLYNDLLVIAKEKSRDKYSLKEWIKLSDMWLDLASVPQFIPNMGCLHHLSFVIGWPNSNNQVAVFTSKNIRDIWYQVLVNHIQVVKEKEKASLPIKIALDDLSYSVTKSLMVSNKESAHSLVERCISEFRLQSRSSSDYQLHMSSETEENLRLIYGFENPFSIYTNLLRSSKFTSLTNFLPEIKLLLKAKNKNKTTDSAKNKMTLLKRMLSRNNSIGKLFGRELCDVVEADRLCRPLMIMLGEVYVNAPSCTGIFRRCASPLVKNLKNQLDSGDESVLEDIYIHDMASLLKEFLRSMPDCLLVSSLYSEWIKIASTPNKEFSIEQIKRLVNILPQSHQLLLKHLLCVLNSVAQSSEFNLMAPYNLAVCISQCLLWSPETATPSSMSNVSSISSFPSCSSLEQYNDIAKTNHLVQFLIEKPSEIFGSECLTLFDHLAQRRSSVLASASNLSRGSTDSDSSQTSITALKTKNSPTYGFMNSGAPNLKTLYSKKGMYASSPLLSHI